jgi:small-conductance mechanosensitive channel
VSNINKIKKSFNKIFMKKKLIYIIPLIAFSLLAVAPVAFGQFQQTTPPTTPDSVGGWLTILQKIATWFYSIILAISVFMILMAGFNYLTAGGDQAKVKKASQMLIYAIVGIVVAIIAFSISKVVTSVVSGS